MVTLNQVKLFFTRINDHAEWELRKKTKTYLRTFNFVFLFIIFSALAYVDDVASVALSVLSVIGIIGIVCSGFFELYCRRSGLAMEMEDRFLK